jgi:hypothetical protein
LGKNLFAHSFLVTYVLYTFLPTKKADTSVSTFRGTVQFAEYF